MYCKPMANFFLCCDLFFYLFLYCNQQQLAIRSGLTLACVCVCVVLQVADNGKSCLQKQPSSAADTVVQAIAHTRLPLCGVQFHPESVGTAFGRQLLYNFAAITAEWHVLQSSPLLSKPLGMPDILMRPNIRGKSNSGFQDNDS